MRNAVRHAYSLRLSFLNCLRPHCRLLVAAHIGITPYDDFAFCAVPAIRTFSYSKGLVRAEHQCPASARLGDHGMRGCEFCCPRYPRTRYCSFLFTAQQFVLHIPYGWFKSASTSPTKILRFHVAFLSHSQNENAPALVQSCVHNAFLASETDRFDCVGSQYHTRRGSLFACISYCLAVETPRYRLLSALFVFEGDCSCCFHMHDGMKCDKPPQYLANGIVLHSITKHYAVCQRNYESILGCLAPIGKQTRDQHEDWHATATSGALAVAPRVPCCSCSLIPWSALGSDSRRRRLSAAPISTHGKHPNGRFDRTRCIRRRRKLGTSRRERARYGFRACRIGEARHP